MSSGLHLLRRGRVFHLRVRLPRELAGRLCRREIVRTLRTRDPRVARFLSAAIAVHFPQLWALARMAGTTEEIDHLLDKWFDEAVKPLCSTAFCIRISSVVRRCRRRPRRLDGGTYTVSTISPSRSIRLRGAPAGVRLSSLPGRMMAMGETAVSVPSSSRVGMWLSPCQSEDFKQTEAEGGALTDPPTYEHLVSPGGVVRAG